MTVTDEMVDAYIMEYQRLLIRVETRKILPRDLTRKCLQAACDEMNRPTYSRPDRNTYKDLNWEEV